MSELSPEAQALLEQARGDGAPTGRDRERVQRALMAAIASPVPPDPAREARLESLSGSGAPALPWAAKAVAAAVLAAAGVTGLALWSRPGPTPAAAPAAPTSMEIVSPAPPSPPAATPAPLPALVPEAKAQVPPPAAPSRRAAPSRPAPSFAPLDLSEPVSPPSRPDDVLAAELRLMRQAQVRLGAGEAARALEMLDEHARLFPAGVLREERAAARVQALCALGRADEGRAEAARFLAEAPQSPYASRVRAACQASR